MGLWWLSFVDPQAPEGARFLGVCIVEGDNIAQAMSTAWFMACNPGGDIMGYDVSDIPIPTKYRRRLLTKEEAEAVPIPAMTTH